MIRPRIGLPFLAFSRERLSALIQVRAETATFFRLYGSAILALLANYGFGLVDSLQGHFPAYAVVTGIVSNGGASLALVAGGTWKRNLSLTAFFLVITALLVLAMFAPGLALRPLISF